MRLEDYTDDVLCSVMNLGEFVPPDVPRAIRLLLKPSFHPEVCVTIQPQLLHVVALDSMLWRQPFARPLPLFSEMAPISDEQFQAQANGFARAAAEHAKERTHLCIDGMPISALYIKDDERAAFGGQPLETEQRGFVVSLLRLAYSLIASVPLRARVAQCGQYLDNTFVVAPEASMLSAANIMVLGTPEQRADYFDALRRGLEDDAI